MEALKTILTGTWDAFFLSAPFLLFGLFIAGILHVLMSRRIIERLLGGSGLLAVCSAACFGIPVPICSCGIVPLSIELRRKGASRPANMSFLISTPESDIDAILLTYGMCGPIMAVARPVAGFLTSLVAGILAIAFPEKDGEVIADECDGDDCDDDCDSKRESDAVGLRGFGRSFAHFVREIWNKPLKGGKDVGSAPSPLPTDTKPFPSILKSIFRYAFAEMLDDIAFWLLIGLVLTGFIGAFVPSGLSQRGLGSGLLPTLLMIAAGIPLYVCASSSTPIAAALVAKGVSPGAAMAFLLTGPATNMATLVLLTRHFGKSFVKIYLFSIASVSLLSALLLDYLIGVFGWNITAKLSAAAQGVPGIFQWVCALVLAGLMLWRLIKGAWKNGYRDLAQNMRSLGVFLSGRQNGAVPVRFRRPKRKTVVIGAAALLLFYLFSGFYIVPLDSLGYEFRFGRLTARDLPPGLHYAIPYPVGKTDVWRTRYSRKTDVGFRTDLAMVAKRRNLMMDADPAEWHSPVSAMNANFEEASYIAADENLIDASFTVHYTLFDPRAFFYRIDKSKDIVSLCAQAAARIFIARFPLDELLTAERTDIEEFVRMETQDRLNALGAGVSVNKVHVVDIHPPQEAVFAFRDVGSAREDKQTRIHQAFELRERELPRARGRAVADIARAQAEADSAVTKASGRSAAFIDRAAALKNNPDVIRYLLYIESAEKLLTDREIFIVPPGTQGRGVVLWRDTSPVPPKGKPE